MATLPLGDETRLRRFIEFFETLDRASVAQLGEIYAAGAQFRDPFNDVRGLTAIEAIFVDMFERTRSPRFIVTGSVLQGADAFVTWDFVFALGRRELRVQGCSHLRFDGRGLVDVHRDYWDVAGELYERLPVLGTLMRALRRRLSASGGSAERSP